MLLDFQETLVRQIFDSYRRGNKRILIQAPTGSGKSYIIKYLADNAKTKCEIITHRKELKKMFEGKVNVTVHMVETFKRRDLTYPDLMLIDECFVKGTKVSGQSIEKIKVGDLVDSFNHKTNTVEKKKVIAVSKKWYAGDLVLTKVDKCSLISTPEHPIYAVDKHKYIKAKMATANQTKVYILKHKMSLLPKRHYRLYKHKCIQFSKSVFEKTWEGLLQQGMLLQNSGLAFFKKNVPKQPDDESKNSPKSFKNIETNRAQAPCARGEWKRNDKTSANPFRFITSWLGGRRYNQNKERKRFAVSLQSRFIEHTKNDSCRNRWLQSLFSFKTTARQKENTFFRKTWLQSFKVQKQTSIRQPKGCFVYNLEVEDNNNYFANGILVHNCHLSIFDKVIDNAPDTCSILGFSATPIRTGKQRPLSDFYSDMIKAPNAESLIEQGYLVPTVNYSYESVDWTKAKKTAGDYDLSYQSEMFEKRKVYEGVIKNYLRLTPNTKTMVFTPNIESARKLTRHMQDNNLPAVCVDSQMKKEVVEHNTEWFKSSKNGILVNCSLLTTGFDCPDVETIILYRATTSRALYNQMIGRGVRINPGKTHCTVLDFGENIKRFGFWEDDYPYSLYKKQSKKDPLPPIRLCPKCDRMNKLQDKKCGHCDFIFPVKILKDEEAELKLIKKKQKIGYYLHQVHTIAEAKKVIAEYGYKPGWWYMNKHRYPHLTE